MVNIGLHYVAATNSTTPIPKDTDGDGILDYAEDANGNGAVDANETDWTTQYTVTNVWDPTNSVYDDIDLSGNGLVGRIKEALGMGPFEISNPLVPSTLPNNSIITGYFQSPLAFPPNIDQRETFKALINGVATQTTAIRQDQSNAWNLGWDTSTLPNGPTILQTGYSVENNATGNNSIGYGAPILVNVSNVLTFNPQYDLFSTSLNIVGTFNIDVSSYQVQIFDANSNLLHTITGTPSSGQINESWDLTDGSGNVIVNGPVQAQVQVTPQDGGVPIALPIHNFILIMLHLPGNQFAVAWGWNPADENQINALDEDFGLGVVDTLNSEGNPDTDYVLVPNDNAPFSSTFQWTDDSVAHGKLQAALTDSATGLFFFYGHGNWGWIGNGLARSNHPNSVIYAYEVATWLGNGVPNGNYSRDGQQGVAPLTALNHPYKLVILYACDAYTADWANAFGIHYFEGNGTQDTVASLDARGLPPQSFVSWPESFDAWTGPADRGIDSGEAIYDETTGIAIMFADWQQGTPLNACVQDLTNYLSSFSDPRENFWNIRKVEISGASDLNRSN